MAPEPSVPSTSLSLAGGSETLAREAGRGGITANIVVSGRVATDSIRFLEKAKAGREGRPVEEVMAESTDAIALARHGQSQEHAGVVAFAAGSCASCITGSIIRIDGGLIAGVRAVVEGVDATLPC